MKGVLFDLDGTLIDSMWVWEKTDREFLSRYGYEADEAYNKTIVSLTFSQGVMYILERFPIPLSAEQVKKELFAIAYGHYEKDIALKAGVREFLEYLKDKRIPMAIATSCVPEMCEAVLRRHGLLEAFEAIVYTEEVGRNKDEADIFLEAAGRIGVPPEDCLVFEDSLHAVGGAKKAGMKVIGVFDRFSKENEAQMRRLCFRYVKEFGECLEEEFLRDAMK